MTEYRITKSIVCCQSVICQTRECLHVFIYCLDIIISETFC